MSRLTSRGTSKSSLYSSTDAADFVVRSKGPHTLRWKASAYRWLSSSGAEELLMDNIPIVGGTLSMDSSDQIRRKLSLDVGGAAALEPRTWHDPLVPFGQFIRFFVTIDRSDGTWFPWLKCGEFQIQSYVFERPSQIATVEAVDHSGVVNEFLHTQKKSYGNRTLFDAVDQMIRAALPNSAYRVDAHPSAKTTKILTWVSDASSPRWEEAVKLAEAKGFDLFFDWNGDPVLRPNLGDGQDDIIPENGPDVGTKSNPIMTIADGEGGSLIGMTATITRAGAANGVFINVHETADQKSKTAKARAARGDARVDVQVRALAGTGSPVSYGDSFGRIPIVRDKNVVKITDAIVAQQQSWANTLLSRRRGVVRYIDFTMAGGYHLEPDDKVKLNFDGRTEDHYVQSITFDLKGGETKVRTRELNVSDPGAR
jgi:hypothetical protein